MRRLLLGILAPCALLMGLAGTAAAGVHVRIAVSPTTIPQCGEGHGILVVGNDGTSPILARICFALTRNDTTLLGPLCGRVALAAGERRSHEFTFFVPPRARPTGRRRRPEALARTGPRPAACDGSPARSLSRMRRLRP